MSAVTVFQQRPRGMFVKNLRPTLTERGKIKIGEKGKEIESRSGTKFQPPQKLDHFVITTLERGKDGNFVRDQDLHGKLGTKPTSIPIRLLFDDIEMNLQTRYVAFSGRNIWCHGDGESAIRDGEGERDCPCPNLERGYDEKRDKLGPVCKINGRLQVLIDGAAGVGGVWVFRTTSWNTIQGLVSSMALIANVTGGRLAGVPLDLTVRPKQATDPQGRQQTIYVVGLEYRGTIDELRDRAYQAALQDAQQGERLHRVHEYAAKLLEAPVIPPDEAREVAEEFYPEQARGDISGAIVGDVSPDDDGTIEVWSEHGEEFRVLPGEAPMWIANRAIECTDDELDVLAEANPDYPDPINAERAKRRKRPVLLEVRDEAGVVVITTAVPADATAAYLAGRDKALDPDLYASKNLVLLEQLRDAKGTSAEARAGLQEEIDAANEYLRVKAEDEPEL